jgi:hypothetical protein
LDAECPTSWAERGSNPHRRHEYGDPQEHEETLGVAFATLQTLQHSAGDQRANTDAQRDLTGRFSQDSTQHTAWARP